MKVLSSREEYLYKTILDTLTLKKTSDGHVVFDLLAGVPDRYEPDEVIKAISKISDCVHEVLDTQQIDDLSQVKELVANKLFGNSN